PATRRVAAARGFALHDPNVPLPNAEPVCRELRQGRLVPLPRRLQPGRKRDRAVGLDADADGVEVTRAGKPLVGSDLGRPATLLDERADADTHVAPLVPQAPLALAERVVVDELADAADGRGVAAAVVAAAGGRDRRLSVRKAIPQPEL